jgi:hypothetical protein
MNNRRLHRPITLLERHSLWLLFGVAVTLALAAAAVVIAVGAFPAFGGWWWGRTVRGYTAPGILLGLASLVFFALTFAYSLRKRAWQETAPALLRSTMSAWLWSHVYFGLLALVFVFFHAGSGLFTSGLSTGLVALIFMALLIFSGVVWRLIYGYVPGVATALVGNYSQSESRDQAQNDLIEIEKLSAGKSAEFHRLKDLLLAGKSVPKRLSLKEELADFETARALAARRQRALRRLKRQATFDTLLQIWKIAHIPLVAFTLIAVAAHVVAVFDIPAQAAPLQTGGFHPASECQECHEAIYKQWTQSMHAHAVTSPVAIAQINQVMRMTAFAGAAKPDPYLLCNNCHSPVGARLTGQATLPFEASEAVTALADEGVSCTVCHQFNGEPRSGQGGFKSFNRDLRPGRIFYGAIADPAGNPYHQSQPGKLAAKPDSLCQNCHNVNYDSNGDGQIEKGADLILQSIYTEWERYAKAGGTQSCVSCHMPVVDDAVGRAAETAAIPGQQDYDAPSRVLHDHSFIGVDYPLDKPDHQREARTALLQKSAALTIDPDSIRVTPDGQLSFNVQLTNSGVGHNLPGGFAFARQMWLEVIVRDQGGNILFQSGALFTSNEADLCDPATLDDDGNPMRQYVQGCPASDPQLVNFQQKLVDQIAQAVDANGKIALDKDSGSPIPTQVGEETWLQMPAGGVVSRIRPSDGQILAPIAPGETRTFEYRVPGVAAKMVIVQVRLLFRNQPPYFLRALAAHQTPGDPAQLAPLIGNLQIVEMTAATRIYTLP